MNNCDLEKLSVPGVKLEPAFSPDITSYKATVPSQLTQIRVDACPSDMAASFTLRGGGGSKIVTLKDGINCIVIEVTAEDGTVKNYTIDITKLSASHASLDGISLSEDVDLIPSFAPDVFEYSCSVPYFQNCISIKPLVNDSQMKVTLNGNEAIKPVTIAIGDTLIKVLVISPDGTTSQVYQIIVTRTQLPFCVRFTDVQDQMNYECPISLTAFYRPVSIKGSNPKHTISGPYLDLLTKKSKTDPMDGTILTESWRVPEYESDMEMSQANVFCIFNYRGCKEMIKLCDFGNHTRTCLFKPPTELDPKTVTEAEWYKEDFSTGKSTEPCLMHTVQERNWEKRLQQVHDSDIDRLCRHAEDHICLYKRSLTKPDDVLSKEGRSPLDLLNQAAYAYASAIKLNPKNPKFHFHLATVLEECYYAVEMYGLRKRNEDEVDDFSSAKATCKDEEIQAICTLHGFSGRPRLEQQLKALDLEYHQLKEQGQSSRADYIQNLYAWKSKQFGRTGNFTLDEENPLAQAFLKYKDALSLDPHNWQYNLHVGRHLLIQKQNKEALVFLQNSLGLRPASAIARCYVGLALIQQDNGSSKTQESLIYLQQGLETLLTELVAPESSSHLQAENLLCIFNAQLLSGFVKLGALLNNLTAQTSISLMTPQQVLHQVVDWSIKALSQCPHKGLVAQDLEWVLLEASFHLLELLVEEAFNKEDWIRKRCQALSALIHVTSIPECKKLIDMQEKVCQLGVISCPCDSHALYLLGMAQLAQYDDRPSADNAQPLQDAKLSFKASIRLENMPSRGSPPTELTSQKWWQERKSEEETKRQKQKAHSDKQGHSCDTSYKPGASSKKGGDSVTSGGSKNRTITPGGSNAKTAPPRGSNANSVTLRGSNANSVTLRGSNANSVTLRGSNANSVTLRGSNANSVTLRGSNGKAMVNAKAVPPGGSNGKIPPAKTAGGSNTKTAIIGGSKVNTASLGKSKTVPLAESNGKSTPSGVARGCSADVLSTPKPQTQVCAEPQSSPSEGPSAEDKPVPRQERVSGPVSVNGSSFLHRLGLARALSRTTDTQAEASILYREVIKMAPEVPDAYTELAELLVKRDPLSAVDVYCQFPEKPDQEQSFQDAFIPGEIVRLLMKCEKYDDPRLPVSMISYGKIMGVAGLEKYINVLEEKCKTSILRTVYAGIHGKSEDDKDLQDFFRFKYWI